MVDYLALLERDDYHVEICGYEDDNLTNWGSIMTLIQKLWLQCDFELVICEPLVAEAQTHLIVPKDIRSIPREMIEERFYRLGDMLGISEWEIIMTRFLPKFNHVKIVPGKSPEYDRTITSSTAWICVIDINGKIIAGNRCLTIGEVRSPRLGPTIYHPDQIQQALKDGRWGLIL